MVLRRRVEMGITDGMKCTNLMNKIRDVWSIL